MSGYPVAKVRKHKRDFKNRKLLPIIKFIFFPYDEVSHPYITAKKNPKEKIAVMSYLKDPKSRPSSDYFITVSLCLHFLFSQVARRLLRMGKYKMPNWIAFSIFKIKSRLRSVLLRPSTRPSLLLKPPQKEVGISKARGSCIVNLYSEYTN